MTQTSGWTSLGESAEVWPGRHFPLGATWAPEATNFAVHAPAATAMWVCTFDEAGVETRHRLPEQSLGVWHGAVPRLVPGTRYGLRADGPWHPADGLRFDPAKLLLDPYARAVTGGFTDDPAVYDDPHADAPSGVDSAAYVPRGVVVRDGFDWGGDTPPRRRLRDTVIYEAHVKGLTMLHPEVPPELRGTYAGLAHPAVTSYLRDLGVTAVELLPVQQFLTEPGVAARGLVNYWGYNTIGFLAPHAAYSSAGELGGQVTEFQAMVKALHAAGLEVILDVVYNHTAEGGLDGPVLSLRGLDERCYHRAPSSRKGEVPHYWDATGCGNTVSTDHPASLRLIMDSLRYWVTEMHVDGFRFDLLPALTRDGHDVDLAGHLLSAIGQDPVLRHVKLIAEPWDATGEGYQVGRFPPPWVEWNDQFRDAVRDFWRGDRSEKGALRSVATRLAGSSDLYADDGRSPYASVNFVTAHDGFTVRDLVTYERKHNDANGEDGRDGTDDNRSSNHGVEGETDDPRVVELRRRQAANLMATLCLSNGVPMITAGDERGRTQGGNNNAYCQDDETSWVDWSAEATWDEVHDVVRTALRLRREHPALAQRHWFEGRPTVPGGPKDLAWIHPSGREMTPEDWHSDLAVVGMFLSGSPLRSPGPRGEQQHDASFLIWLHARPGPVTVALPENDWVEAGEVVLSTVPSLPVGTVVAAGSSLDLDARCVVVLRET
ncbi:glycogen debranching protein GlgX [Nocardioides lentus]|uniref:Glycogen debranching protein GlgX n=1 Tax=Nocardioides lentus TaxID=338077 RepID=A0ABP5B4G8_9ACTN